MLKFLTHKLRTHSLNEENVIEKVEEHDSGTESDDEADRADTGDNNCADVIMKWNEDTSLSTGGGSMGEACACAPAPPPPRLLPEPEPDHLYDHHSSEEELEVINGAPGGPGDGGRDGDSGGAGAGGAGESRRRGASSPPPVAPEKRKWPARSDLDAPARAPSDDEEDIKVETPVRFRTSPPLEALKPRRAGGAGCACAARAPPSPRRRRTPLPPPRRHRPALDFDKMQQLKVGGAGGGGGAGGVRSWRAVGGAGGELSVFCW